MYSNPRVWSKFTTKGDVKLQIQDAPKDRLEEVANLYIKNFATEESLHKAAGIPDSKEALEECKEMVNFMVNDPKTVITICCKDDSSNNGELVAASMIVLEKGEEEDYDIKTKTKELGRLFELMGYCFEKLNDVDLKNIYDDRGIVVHPDHRGTGIAEKLLNVRRDICKANGVSVTGGWMTSFGSQKAADRDGWETVAEVPYEELSKKFGVTFTGVPPSNKYMIAKPT